MSFPAKFHLSLSSMNIATSNSSSLAFRRLFLSSKKALANKARPGPKGPAWGGPEGPMGLGGGVGWGGGATEVRGASRQEPNAEATSAE